MSCGKVATSEKVHEIDSSGAFVRQKNSFTASFGNGPGELPVEPGRYRLIWTPLCPWATRQMIVLKLLGLSDVISTGTVSPVRTEQGWEFSLDPEGRDPVLGIRFLPEIYAATDPCYGGRATVPVVVDVKAKKVVNNDYHRLTNEWETAWKPYHKKDAPDLYPGKLQSEIDSLNIILFNEVNNGVYKAGFAESQEAYEDAVRILFERLDRLEERLDKRRFLFGDSVTDSDVRLYVTLARFDTVYYYLFRCDRKRVRDYPNLWNYAKDLYSIPAFRESTDFEAIKRGYFLGSVSENPFQILPKGPDNSIWNEPNDRAEKFDDKEAH